MWEVSLKCLSWFLLWSEVTKELNFILMPAFLWWPSKVRKCSCFKPLCLEWFPWFDARSHCSMTLILCHYPEPNISEPGKSTHPLWPEAALSPGPSPYYYHNICSSVSLKTTNIFLSFNFSQSALPVFLFFLVPPRSHGLWPYPLFCKIFWLLSFHHILWETHFCVNPTAHHLCFGNHAARPCCKTESSHIGGPATNSPSSPEPHCCPTSLQCLPGWLLLSDPLRPVQAFTLLLLP